jgi:stalled ribosome rescue protein Dom34
MSTSRETSVATTTISPRSDATSDAGTEMQDDDLVERTIASMEYFREEGRMEAMMVELEEKSEPHMTSGGTRPYIS